VRLIMPFYPYECHNCSHSYEVVKSVAEINTEEKCPKCNHVTKRTIAKQQSIDKNAASDWNRKEFNPGLGGAFTPREARKEAKRRGLIEVGNEKPEKIEKHYKQQREQDVQRRYDF